MGMQQFDKALEDFDAWVRTEPNNNLAYYNRASAFVKLNRIDEAITDHYKRLELDPGNAYSHNTLGFLFFNYKKDYPNALKEFNNAINADAGFGNAYLNRSRAHFMMNNRSAAKADVEKAKQLGVSIPQNYLDLLK